MRRIICFLMTMILTTVMTAFPVFAKPEWPSDTGVQSEAGIIMDMDSGAVLWGQNIHKQLPPASITKLLTALVTIENCSLDEEVTFSREAMMRVDSDSGNKLDLAEGDVLTVKECLYVLILQSSNQTANALAEHVAGSIEAFADKMNEKAASLGCQESHFVTPSGLHDDAHLTSAYDMALIARAAFQNEALLEIASTKKSSIPATINNPEGRTFSIEHKLIITEDETSENYYPYAVAGKTGYTLAAGQTLVTYAKKDGRGLIAVTMKSSQRTHYSDTKTILDFGFARFKNLNIAENEIDYVTGDTAAEIGGTSYEPSDLYYDDTAVITLPNDAVFTDAEKRLETELSEDAPAGSIGKMIYTYNDRVIGQAWLMSTSRLAADTQALAEPSQPETEAENSSQQDTLPDTTLSEKTKGGFPAVFIGAGAAVLAAAVIGFVVWRKRQQRLEEERRRRMRERRRQRLQDIGCSEEEFERLLNERRQKHEQ